MRNICSISARPKNKTVTAASKQIRISRAFNYRSSSKLDRRWCRNSFLNPRYVVRASAPVSGWRRRSARGVIPAARLVAHRDDRAALPALRAAFYLVVDVEWVRSCQHFVCHSLPPASELVALNFAAHFSILLLFENVRFPRHHAHDP